MIFKSEAQHYNRREKIMTQIEKIAYIKTAPNMVEIESVLNSVTADYITRYANEVELCPAGNYGEQSKWIERAVEYFIGQIHADKLAIWQHIPARFKSTSMYQRLSVSQFLRGQAA